MLPNESIQKRRRNRLILIVGCLITVVGLGAAAYFYQGYRKNANLKDNRAEAMQAFQAGDYGRTVTILEAQRRQINGDAEALYAYAQAKEKVSASDPANRSANQMSSVQAFQALQRSVELDPTNREAGVKLASIYLRIDSTQYRTGALTIANNLLAQAPDDPELLLIKVEALERLERATEGLEVAEKLLALQPERFVHYRRVLRLMAGAGASPDQIVTQAQLWQREKPDDLRPMLALAYATAYAQEPVKAVAALRAIAEREPPDGYFVFEVVDMFDKYELHREATRYLLLHIDEEDPQGVRTAAAVRLLLVDHLPEGIKLLETLDLDNGAIKLLAWHAIAHRLNGDTQTVAASLKKLKARADGPMAQAWSDVLSASLAQQPDLPEVIKRAEAAVEAFPKVAEFWFILATARAETDDRDAAMIAVDKAIELSKLWGRPHELKSRLHLAAGEMKAAASSASRAVSLLDTPEAHKTYLQARAAEVAQLDAREVDRGLRDLAQLGKRAPSDADFPLLALEFMVGSNRINEARAYAASLLESDVSLRATHLTRLVELDASHDLGVSEQLENRLSNLDEASVGGVRALALQQLLQGKPDEGLAMIDRGLSEARGNQRSAMLLIRGEYLERLGRPRAAAAAYFEAADARPNHLPTQKRVVASLAARTDRQRMDTVLTRLRSLTGEEAPQWRVARAQWLLESPELTDDQARQAMKLTAPLLTRTPESALPLLIRAQAAQHLRQYPVAIDSLRTALAVLPEGENAVQARLSMARVYTLQRDHRRATDELKRVLRSNAASSDQQAQAAQMLVVQGESVEAFEVLSNLNRREALSADARLVLASLLAQRRQIAESDAILQELLDSAVSLEVVNTADAIYARAGMVTEAQGALEKLDSLEVSEAEKHEVWAHHYARLGQSQEAVRRFKDAIQAEPDSAARYAALTHYLLSIGQADTAIDIARNAPEIIRNRPEYRILLRHENLLKRQRNSPEIVALAAAMVRTPQLAPASDQALALLTKGEAENNLINLTNSLGQLADSNPNHAALANFSARLRHRLGQSLMRSADASEQSRGREMLIRSAELASRTMYAFPRDELSPQIATEAFAEVGQWSQSLNAANLWGTRSPRHRIPAELAVARAQRARGNAEAAVQTLVAYERPISQGDEAFAAVAYELSMAYMLANQPRNVVALLQPLLAESPRYRAVWLSVIKDSKLQPTVAERWLETLATHTPGDDAQAQADLAAVWYLTSSRAQPPESFMQQAVHHLDQALAIKRDEMGWWALRGEIAEQLGDLPTAESSYRQALRVLDVPGLKNNLAMTLVRQNKALEEALALARQAVQSEPENANFLDTLAQTLAVTGRAPQAVVALERARVIDPRNPDYARRLASVLREVGRIEDAQKLEEDFGLGEALPRPATQ